MLKITKNTESDTKTILRVVVDDKTLQTAKQHAVDKLGKNIKIPGFRPGTAPASLVEKSIDQNALAEEFLNDAIQHSYPEALKQVSLSPIAPPKIEVTKFVPFTLVEFSAVVVTLGAIKLADYKSLKAKREVISPDKADVEQVLENMRTQMAEKKDVSRTSKMGDQLVINFSGKDDKGGDVSGAKGDSYPLELGSKTFIPGFEDHLVGLKSGDKKEFVIKFPKDYGVKALQAKNVTFSVEVIKVQEITKPELDDKFVKKVAPDIKTLAELREDIKKQLAIEAEQKADRAYENAIVAEIVEKSSVSVPDELVEEQAQNVLRDLQQNILYRGQTMEEYLAAIGMTEDEQRQKEILPEAHRRLKAGILLSEIAEREQIEVSADEINTRVAVLRAKYASDQAMVQQLDDPNNQRELGAQIVTEKTVAKIISYNNQRQSQGN